MFIDGEMGGGPVQVQQVLPAGQMERARFRQQPLARFEQMGDVFRTEGLKLAGVGQRRARCVDAIDFASGDDVGDMLGGVETPLA